MKSRHLLFIAQSSAMFIALTVSPAIAEEVKQRLLTSCLAHIEKQGKQISSGHRDLCDCMVEHLMENNQVTDALRNDIANQWTGDGKKMEVTLLAWGECYKKMGEIKTKTTPQGQSGSGNCRVDHPDGINITQAFVNSEEECVRKICEVYGKSNAVGGRTLCIFRDKVVREYTSKSSTPESEKRAAEERKERMGANRAIEINSNSANFLDGLKSSAPFVIHKALIDGNVKDYGKNFLPALEEGRKYMLTKPQELRAADHQKTLDYIGTEIDKLRGQ